MMLRTRTCDCGATIFFAMTAADKRMPVDRNTLGRPDGNLAVWQDGGRVRCRVVKPEDELGTAERRFMSHFGNCPKAKEFSGKNSARVGLVHTD
jgi:hypothetical protein